MINPDFILTLTEKETQAVLEHEVLHILFKHIIRGKNRDLGYYNIACDMAINQLIQNLPEKKLLPHTLPELNAEPMREAEYYYNLLIKWAKNRFKRIPLPPLNLQTIDEHSGWSHSGVEKESEHKDIEPLAGYKNKHSAKQKIHKTETIGDNEYIIDTAIKKAYKASHGIM